MKIGIFMSLAIRAVTAKKCTKTRNATPDALAGPI